MPVIFGLLSEAVVDCHLRDCKFALGVSSAGREDDLMLFEMEDLHAQVHERMAALGTGDIVRAGEGWQGIQECASML